MDGLQINMEADYKGVPSLRAALQFMGCDGQCGGTAHRLQQAQASLLSQQRVHAELTQAYCPGKGIAWWWSPEKEKIRIDKNNNQKMERNTIQQWEKEDKKTERCWQRIRGNRQ